MKKKFLIVLTLFLIVLPLAGCGEESTKYDVNVSLSRLESDDINVNDCSKVSGGGTYEEGSSVTLTVDTSNLCQFKGWTYDNGEIVSTNKTFTIFNLSESVNVKAVVGSSGVLTSTTTKVHFEGIYETYALGETVKLNYEEYNFPYYSELGSSQVTDTTISISDSSKLLNEILVNDKTLNLNYIYLNGVFQPYKLAWRKGTYDSASNSCSSYTAISGEINNIDISTLSNGDKDICVAANIDVTTGAANSDLKTLAINNMKKSEFYITTNSNSACRSATKGTVSVSDDCMYVANLGNLINKSGITYYYAMTNDGLLEGVSTTTSSGQIYLICDNLDACSSNTYQVEYYNVESTKLKINEFISSISNSESSYTYDYNYLLKDIVPTKINGYYLTYLSDGTSPNYNPTEPNAKKLPTTSNLTKAATIYNITFDGDNASQFASIKTLIDKNIINSIYVTGSNTIESSIRQKIYSLITNNIESNESLKDLRNYKFNIDIDDTNKTIKIEPVSAILSDTIYSEKQFIIANESICSNTNTDTTCLSNISSNIKSAVSYIKSNLTSNLSDLQIEDIYEDSGKTIYKFMNSDKAEITIIYNNSEGIFELGDNTTIEFTNGTELNMQVGSISITESTVIGTIVQTLTINQEESESPYSIVTTIDTKDVPSGLNIDEDKIIDVYNIFNNGTFYDFTNISGKYIFLHNNEKLYEVTIVSGQDNTLQYKTDDNKEYQLTYPSTNQDAN
jgi:hypothetical protein